MYTIFLLKYHDLHISNIKELYVISFLTHHLRINRYNNSQFTCLQLLANIILNIGTIFTRYNQIDTIVQNPLMLLCISNLYEQNIDIKFLEADY